MTSTVRRSVILVLLMLAIQFAFASGLAGQGNGTILVGRIDSPIDPISVKVLNGWLEQAETSGATLVVLEIDTPGGLLSSMREMAGDLLDSPIPVAVFVTPSGARAASAGTFIVAAGHVAAMTPGTTIGAASPVDAGGEDLPETIKNKISQDAAALLRGIAMQRNRNSEALESTIFEAKSFTAEEAVDLGVIDLIALGVPDLLLQIDGMTVKVLGTERNISTAHAVIERIELTPVQRFQGWLASPQLVFIFFTVGGILLLIELMSPGGWVPGVLGAGLLVLAFLGIGNLPVNWIGLAVMAAGLALVFVEIQAPGWGGFGAAGGIALILGGFLLFGDSSAPGLPAPDMRVGWGVLGGTGMFLAVSVIGLIYFSRKARGIHVESRTSQIIGQIGVVRRDLDPQGTVRVAGELWTAVSESGDTIEIGENIVVADMDGITLKVLKTSSLDVLERGLT